MAPGRSGPLETGIAAGMWLLITTAGFVSVATASEPSFISVPPMEGWVSVAQEPPAGIPHLSRVHLHTSDGQAEALVSIHVLGTGQPTGFRPSGVIMLTDWLAPTRNWKPTGNDARCFRDAALSRSDSSQSPISGQVRCRRGNFMLVFNFWARSAGALSERRWERDFRDIVSRTETRAPCLTPQELTFIADGEGPPFVTRTAADGSVRVAARSMCGTAGCPCFRYERNGQCFDLVLPVERCLPE